MNPPAHTPGIFRFWFPLASTWIMMALEGPFLAAVIARLPEPKFNLAAYGVAIAFAMIMESPIIMMMSAANALVKDRASFLMMRRFSTVLNWGITLLMVAFVAPPVFHFVTLRLIGLPENVMQLCHRACLILLPWPAAIGYRRLYQGIMIGSNLTHRVAYGTVVRLVSMAGTATVLGLCGLNGSTVAACALANGVVLEAAASRLMAGRVVRRLLAGEIQAEHPRPLTYSGIARFYFPLALTSMLSLGVQPMTTFFVGRSRQAIESLAVLPVVNSLAFIFRSFGLAFQETVLSLRGERSEGLPRLRRFGWSLAGSISALYFLLLFTPLASLWFHGFSGLGDELTRFAVPAGRILCLIPALEVLICYLRGILVGLRRTTPITVATALEVGLIAAVLYLLVFRLHGVGALSAAAAILIGRIGSILYLLRRDYRPTGGWGAAASR